MKLLFIFAAFFFVSRPSFAQMSYPGSVPFRTEQGSALDVSFLLDAPAGKHGFTRPEGDSLLFADGTPARFWGVNFAWEAQYPEHDQIGPVVDRLRANGINLVRITYLDRTPPRGPVTKLSSDELALDEQRLDKLDRLAAAFVSGGIYMDVVLMMGGLVTDVSGVEETSSLQMFHPEVIDAHDKFTRLFLTHRNPYTGRTWAEEPAVAVLELFNEGDPFYLKKRLILQTREHLKPLLEKWSEWTERHGLKDMEFDLERLDGSREMIRFLAEVQAERMGRLRGLARECGYKGVICDIAGGSYSPAARYAQNASDIHVAHYYHDHPMTDEHGFGIRNASASESGYQALLVAAWEKMPGKPYILGEWDWCYPNEFRAEGPLATAAFAGLQAWSGCIQFAYWSGSWNDSERLFGNGSRIMGVWRFLNDPAVMSLYPAAALMFLRGDVSSCSEEVFVPIDAFTVCSWPPTFSEGLMHRFGAELFASDVLPAKVQPALPSGKMASDTEQVRYDHDAGVLVIDAPRSQAVVGMVAGKRVETKDVVFQIENPFAVVSVSSLTDAPISESDHLLITAVAKAQNSGFEAETVYGKYYARNYGQSPIMIEPVEGCIEIRNAKSPKAFVLDSGGKRIGEGSVKATDSLRLCLEKGRSSQHYEVVSE